MQTTATTLPVAQFDEDQLKPAEKRVFLHCAFEPTGDGDSTTFFAVFSSAQMLQTALKYGHNRPLFIDTTFAVSQYSFPFLTILAFDDHGHGVPVCWAVLPNEQEATFHRAISIFLHRIREISPGFTVSVGLCDDSDTEQNAFEYASDTALRLYANVQGP